MQVIGTCGACGGPVGYLGGWVSIPPQTTHCMQCGAVAKSERLPVVEMEHTKPTTQDEMMTTLAPPVREAIQEIIDKADADIAKAAAEHRRRWGFMS